MAKKKAKKEEKKPIPQYVQEIDKKNKQKYGNIIKNGLDVLKRRRNQKMVSVSPSMDYGLRKGIKEGTTVLVSGDDKSGKTILALHIASVAQNDKDFIQPNGDIGRRVFYFNTEARLDEKHLEGVDGLDPESIVIIEKDIDAPPVPAENIFDAVLSVAMDPENRGSVIIVDSVSNLQSKKSLGEGVKSGMSTMPKILADFSRKVSPIVPDQDIVLILITHLISNPAPFGPSKLPDCGRKIRYIADTILRVEYIKPWMDSDAEDAKQIGQQVFWRVDCASHGTPGTKIEGWIRYGIGIDEKKEALELCNEFNLIERGGAWYYPYGKDSEIKFQGQSKFLEWVDETPEFLETMKERILEVINLESEDEEEEEVEKVEK